MKIILNRFLDQNINIKFFSSNTETLFKYKR
jgi:hypothetical protein